METFKDYTGWIKTAANLTANSMTAKNDCHFKQGTQWMCEWITSFIECVLKFLYLFTILYDLRRFHNHWGLSAKILEPPPRNQIGVKYWLFSSNLVGRWCYNFRFGRLEESTGRSSHLPNFFFCLGKRGPFFPAFRVRHLHLLVLVSLLLILLFKDGRILVIKIVKTIIITRCLEEH